MSRRKKGGKDSAFDDLMSAMGVRRLDDGKGRSRRRGPPPPPRDPEAPTEKIAPVSPTENKPTSASSRLAEPTVPVERVAPGEPADPFAQERATLEARIAALEDTARAHTLESEGLRDQATILQSSLDEARAAVHHADAVLDARRRSGESPPSLAQMLTERGLLGSDEARMCIAALSEARLLDSLLTELEPRLLERVRSLLDGRIQLLGDCERCPRDLPGRATVTVPPARCEVCGGGDARRLVRDFHSAVLMQGVRSVLIVGGSAKAHQQLRQLLDHHRLQLHLVPASVGSSAIERSDVGAALIWVGGGADEALLAAETVSLPRYRVDASDVAGFLGQSVAALNA